MLFILPHKPHLVPIASILPINQEEALHGFTRTLTLPNGQQVTIIVPVGTHDGQIIQLQGQGEQSSSEDTAGSLILTIAVTNTANNASTLKSTSAEKAISTSNSSSGEKTISNHPPPSRLKASIESSGFWIVVVSLGIGLVLSTIKRLPPTLEIIATGVAAFLGLIVAYWSALIEKIYKPLQNRWQNVNPLLPALAAILTTITMLLSFVGIPYLQSDPYTPHLGKPALDDPLNDNSKGYNWAEGHDNRGSCQLTKDGYRVTAFIPPKYIRYFSSCAAVETNFDNFVYEVQMTIIQGDCGSIMFRTDLARSKSYFFRICIDRTYYFERYNDFSGSIDTLLYGDLPNDKKVGNIGLNQRIVFAVIARSINFDLWVGSNPVAKAFDSSDKALKQGQIAVAAEFDTAIRDKDNEQKNCQSKEMCKPTVVVFSNAKVWSL